jgi:hypothetical protein
MDHEAEPVHGRADHRDFTRSGGGGEDCRRCSKHGISSATFKAQLKKLLAEAMLNNAMLRDVASKKW